MSKNAKKSRSAVPKVQKSGLALIHAKPRRGKPVTMAGLARIDWKPWRRTAGMRPTELIPDTATVDSNAVNCRLAYGVMLLSRTKLIALHANVDHAKVDQMMAALFETAEWLKATAFMVEAAYIRVLASAAAAEKRGLKFKGVD